MIENRKDKRLYFKKSLRVFDQEEWSLIGHILDISAGGMQLASGKPIKVGKEFLVRLELESQLIDLHAECLWCRKHKNAEYYKSGFRFATPISLNVLNRNIETAW